MFDIEIEPYIYFLTQEIYLSITLFLHSTVLIENDCVHFCD